MDIDIRSLTLDEQKTLYLDLKEALYHSRPVVRVWELEKHPFYPGRLYEGLIVELEHQPYVVLSIHRGYEIWRVSLGEPTDEEMAWYRNRKEEDSCPTCGYVHDDKLDQIQSRYRDMCLEVHLLLHLDTSDAESGALIMEKIREMDSWLWPRTGREARDLEM